MFVRTDEWCVSYQYPVWNGDELIQMHKLHIYKFEGNKLIKHPIHYGKLFDSQKEASQYAYEHGFLVKFGD